MAEAILGALLQQLRENVHSLIDREVHLFFRVKNDAEKLSRTLSTVLDVLEDAESRKIKDKSLANWLKNLKDAAYDATDALEEWALEVQQLDEAALTDRGCTSQVSDSLLSCLSMKHIIFRRKMAKRFKDLINKFDEIATERSKFHLSPVVVETGSQFDAIRESSSTSIEPKIYGRDGDKKEIIDILLSDVSSEENVSICSIVGMGGLGKTTLAQSVYNDERVISHFDVKIWVCVSDPFDVKRVLKAIIVSLNAMTPELENLGPLQNKVCELLTGKRYLLVLDDMWNEHRDEWNKLKSSLMRGAKGSSIIITTRLDIVASITGTIPKYCLKPLSDDDCWTLFKGRAFGDKGEENLVLVAIGKDIVKKCKGVPLAAKSLGSLLSFKPNESYWKLVRDSKMWNLEEKAENEILPALRLSYKHLPLQLKRCYAYCSIFPKDHKMDKDELIRLWIANGFIQSDGGMELEDIGNVIFDELLWRSFFQDYDGYRSCKMHDLMHDLASYVMEGDGLAVEGDMGIKQVTKTRHLTLICSNLPSPAGLDCLFKSQTSLRSFIFFRPFIYDLDNSSSNVSNVSNLRCLRVLNLSRMKIETLSSSICHLKLLRYLNLSENLLTSLPDSIHGLRSLQMLDLNFNKRLTMLPQSIGKLEPLRCLDLSYCKAIPSLPESIGDLRNLRSLKLEECEGLELLPKTMRNINKLRHLDLSECSNLTKMPVGIGELTCLETLIHFVVARPNDSDSGRCGSISELKNLNNLRVLKISGLENIRNVEEVEEAKLRDKQYLTQLELTWRRPSGNNDQGSNSSCTEVLEALRPPPCLQTFGIEGYTGAYLQGFLGTLTSLKRLQIMGCENLTSVSEGLRRQTSLQSLHIWHCSEFELAADDLQHLISLQRLQLWELPKMTSFPESIQHLTMLQHLEIFSCNNLRRLPEGLKHLAAIQSVNIAGCHPELYTRCEKEKGKDWHIISHIPKLDIRYPARMKEESLTSGEVSEENASTLVTAPL